MLRGCADRSTRSNVDVLRKRCYMFEARLVPREKYLPTTIWRQNTSVSRTYHLRQDSSSFEYVVPHCNIHGQLIIRRGADVRCGPKSRVPGSVQMSNNGPDTADNDISVQLHHSVGRTQVTVHLECCVTLGRAVKALCALDDRLRRNPIMTDGFFTAILSQSTRHHVSVCLRQTAI